MPDHAPFWGTSWVRPRASAESTTGSPVQGIYSLGSKWRKTRMKKHHVNPDIAMIQSQFHSQFLFPPETVMLQSLKNKTMQECHNKDED